MVVLLAEETVVGSEAGEAGEAGEAEKKPGVSQLHSWSSSQIAS